MIGLTFFFKLDPKTQTIMGYVTIETIWMDRVILGLSAIFNFGLFSLLLKQIREKSTKSPKTSKSRELSIHIRMMNTVALSTIFFNALFNVIRAPVSFGAFTFVNCGFQSGEFIIVIFL